MSLLDTKTGFTTPWHCSVALMRDGVWMSAPKGDFEKDPSMEVVYEDGRPSYFRQRDPEEVAAAKTSVETVNEKLQIRTSTTATPCLDSSEEAKIVDLVKVLSRASTQGVTDEQGNPINPFFGSENPLLNPNSGDFSTKAWLQTLMSISSRDPERYPKSVAGVAYRNLSVHGFGDPTDYQKTFGNYPFELLGLTKRLMGRVRKTRIQILRDFDGLVKSGEMLLVLGRPGRQVRKSAEKGNNG